jgi:glycosyltransferase involved in cell wall biosynthesis
MIDLSISNLTGLRDPGCSGVTIGIPVYNEELFIEATIRSAAPQCEVLLIVDNCSTDNSARVVERLAGEYPNVIFHRHKSNRGAAKNFEFILNEAKTPYFMWLGAHDLIPPKYVWRLKELLDKDRSASLAFGGTTHIDRLGKEVSRYEYTFSDHLAKNHASDRLLAIIKFLHDCSLIHGLFRTASLKAAWGGMEYLKGDHVLLARAILGGKFLYAPETSLFRREVRHTVSDAAQLERISGLKQEDRVRLPATEMQCAQYELAVQESRQMVSGALAFRTGAWFWLVSRFGPFSKRKAERIIEKVVYEFSRGIRICRRAIARIARLIKVERK